MNARKQIVESLRQSPAILQDLISRIPQEKLHLRRFPGKWSIHEHACHIVDVQPMLIDRLKRFGEKGDIIFKPYLPGTNSGDSHLKKLDLKQSLICFHDLRNRLIETSANLVEAAWEKIAKHPEYELYSAEILLRHILLHDHTHMYRIEELWLTRGDYL